MIRITQNCDGCGEERNLVSTTDEHNGGWRTVAEGRPKRHLCAGCIAKALGKEQTGGRK